MNSILGAGGYLKGYFRENGDKTELLSRGGQLLGIYDSQKDMTFKPGGQFVGYGNQLMILLED